MKPMKNRDHSSQSEETSIRFTPYIPEDQVFQRLHLCAYLRELDEMIENEDAAPKE